MMPAESTPADVLKDKNSASAQNMIFMFVITANELVAFQ
jgi:hypothetical protein